MIKQKKPRILEKDIQYYFLSLAEMYGFYFFRTNNVKISGGKFLKMKDKDKGHPDAIILKNSNTFYVEFKSTTGKLSEFQKIKRKEIESRGGKYIVIASILNCTEFFAINK